jgi:hypothetical protein
MKMERYVVMVSEELLNLTTFVVTEKRERIMTCKDCLYYEVCPLGLAIKGSTGTCLKFKNKSDYAEVKHGEWYLIDECSNEGVYCSVCHKKVYKIYYGNIKVMSNYCPHCGAKMRGAKDE